MNEIWKDIPKFNNEYQISNFGKIRSKHAVIIRSNGTTHTRVSKILKPAKSKDGYYKGAVCVDKKMRTYCIHRLVAEAFCFKSYETQEVNHINGVKTDNRAENLEWCNRSENILHALRLGLLIPRKGSQKTESKMDEATAKKLKEMIANGIKRSLVCEQLGITVHMYKDVQRGKTWMHV
jgi:hypothetical protein